MILSKAKELILQHQVEGEDPVDTLIRILVSGEVTLGDLMKYPELKTDKYFIEDMVWFLGRKINPKIDPSILNLDFVETLEQMGCTPSTQLRKILAYKYESYISPVKTVRQVVTMSTSGFFRRKNAGIKTLRELQEHLKVIHPALSLDMKWID